MAGDLMKTFDLVSGAEFLNLSVDTLGDLVGDGTIPAAKIGKRWVLTDESLETYLRDEIERQTNARRGQPIIGNRRAKVPTAFKQSIRRGF